ncbi:MAG: hypothetical protein CMI13_14585 [Oleibacter sp.]|nr:hypothetical protein [Thalassolituus sp.]|tara:strand:+ start:406 stop:792 length:387 start_codon:yes stop_codon:yes gene_type:complete
MSLTNYELLGLAPGAGREEIKRAFKRLAMAFHPDLNPQGQAHFGKICRAYQELMGKFEQMSEQTFAQQGQKEEAVQQQPSVSAEAFRPQANALSISRERRTSRRLPQHRRFELVQESHYKGTSVSEKV